MSRSHETALETTDLDGWFPWALRVGGTGRAVLEERGESQDHCEVWWVIWGRRLLGLVEYSNLLLEFCGGSAATEWCRRTWEVWVVQLDSRSVAEDKWISVADPLRVSYSSVILDKQRIPFVLKKRRRLEQKRLPQGYTKEFLGDHKVLIWE